ncbi:hypothetical protein JX266_008749 [Neoarthrinium moseri]|nr:hypothetical protein JX266_008749 [Neoarthrinium moseri]
MSDTAQSAGQTTLQPTVSTTSTALIPTTSQVLSSSVASSLLNSQGVTDTANSTTTPGTNATTNTTISAATSATTSATASGIAAAVAPGVSPGVTAAVAIICTIVGAAIASIIFLILRRRSKSSSHSSQSPALPQQSSRKLFDELPQSVDHHELRTDIANLETSIKNFVDNFFHDGLLQEVNLNNTAFTTLTTWTPSVSSKGWSSLLIDTRTRSTALRALIARAIFDRIRPTGDPKTTLLPPGVVECYTSMISKRKGVKDLENAWRSLTGKLLDNNQVSVLTDRVHDERHRQLMLDIDRPLRHFRNRRPHDRYQEMLQSILHEGALFGLKIFSQFERIEIVWESPSGRPLVVFPRVTQHMSTNDKEYASPVEVTKLKYA